MSERMQGKPAGGIWELLDRQMQQLPEHNGALGLWAQILPGPSGLWQRTKEETLNLAKGGQDIWQNMNDETLIISRSSGTNLWEIALRARPVEITSDEETAVLRRDEFDLWEELDEETLIITPSERGVWTPPRVRDISNYRPVRASGWAIKKLETAKGEAYYVLKNMRQGTYLKLTEEQVYLWDLMDGSQSVKELAVAYFLKYQTLEIEGLFGLIGQLSAKGFLETGEVNVYQAAGMALWRQKPIYWVRYIVGLLFRAELSVKGVDKFYGFLHRIGAWLLFTRPMQIMMMLVSVLGLPAFFFVGSRGDLSLITGSGEGLEIGLAGLLVAQVFAVLTHESAHALTTKHYGRQVRRGGVGLYFGMLTFFMDTTDIWMERRGPRLAVTWAGPYSGFFLGGLASLALLFSPPNTLAGLTFQFATFCYAISFLNLNPLLKLDGYYLLMDWLEIPMLRERSIHFVRTGLWQRLRKLERLNREELIFAVFGILSILWTGFAVYAMLQLYGSSLFQWIAGFTGSTVAWGLVIVLGSCLGFMLVRHLLAARRQKKMMAVSGRG